ncbi:hypothetical protein DZE36_18000 [Xanthomonas campestris pv. campestris]|nr:hypothetical protein AEA00_06365 [Xanthomonas campestris pv. campestris]RFF52122.1 hypothetical protein D0A42_03805 [Xanthomonas campestris pv. campestris]RFF72764.1 hypothetical protein DZE36_18000 [Xanthomonas campestris pv. campestris]
MLHASVQMTPCVLLSAARATARRCRYPVLQHALLNVASRNCMRSRAALHCTALKHSTEHR